MIQLKLFTPQTLNRENIQLDCIRNVNNSVSGYRLMIMNLNFMTNCLLPMFLQRDLTNVYTELHSKVAEFLLLLHYYQK